MRYFLDKKHFIFIVMLSAFCSLRSVAQRSVDQSDSIEVSKTITKFIEAFSNFQWDDFTSYFSEDATAFFPPSAEFPFRANNKAEMENIFKQFFEKIKKQKPGPPYLNIVPKDLRIQTFHSVAIVSFILEDPSLLGRRTLVFNKYGDKWRIIHLHASGVPVTTEKKP